MDADVTDDRVELAGRDDGFVRLAFRIVDDGAIADETPALEAEVGDHNHDVDDHDRDDGTDDHGHHRDEDGHNQENRHDPGHAGDHSHGEYDAKFFSDPVLAKRGVETIRDGLIDLDPGNEAVYEENAAAYVDELESLHRSYEQRLTDRDHDTIVLAGHDSFRYLSERYGFDVHTPVGLSPDGEVSSDDLAETISLVEERDVEYILWDYFDGDRQSNLIAEAAETVEETLMVSPAESTTRAWLDAGYGDYLGQMREINLPAFETALGAE